MSSSLLLLPFVRIQGVFGWSNPRNKNNSNLTSSQKPPEIDKAKAETWF